MSELNSIYIVICEGAKSEVAYIYELDRYFREHGIKITLVPRAVGTGHYVPVVRKYKEEFKKNKKGKFYIWVDNDIYTRNDQGNAVKYDHKPPNIPDFYFNTFNFEDFLILHYPKDIVLKYQELCEQKGHFLSPLHEEEYMKIIKTLFPDYTKSSLPKDFTISKEVLENAFNSNKDVEIKFHSEFIDMLKNIISAQ